MSLLSVHPGTPPRLRAPRPPALTSPVSSLGSAPPAPAVGADVGLSSAVQGPAAARAPGEDGVPVRVFGEDGVSSGLLREVGVSGGVSKGVPSEVSPSHTASSSSPPANREWGCSLLFWGEKPLRPWTPPWIPSYRSRAVPAAAPRPPHAASGPARPLPPLPLLQGLAQSPAPSPSRQQRWRKKGLLSPKSPRPPWRSHNRAPADPALARGTRGSPLPRTSGAGGDSGGSAPAPPAAVLPAAGSKRLSIPGEEKGHV